MKNFAGFAAIFLMQLWLAASVSAQKLPKTQAQSVLLPETFKIDGKENEFGDKFQCFNENVSLYCTIANDNNCLYIAIQAADPVIVKKVIAGGMKLTICKSGERSERNPFDITFPTVLFAHQVTLYHDINEFSKSDKKDDLIKNINKTLLEAIKLIKISHKGISDSISVYNDIGVKAAVRIGEDLHLTCEILIPLKLIGIESLKNHIAYNIMLNGSSETAKPVRYPNGVTITDVPIGMTGPTHKNS